LHQVALSDLLVVNRSIEPVHGQVVVAAIDHQLTNVEYVRGGMSEWAKRGWTLESPAKP